MNKLQIAHNLFVPKGEIMKRFTITGLVLLMLLLVLSSISCGGMMPSSEDLAPWMSDVAMNDKATLLASRGIITDDFKSGIKIFSGIGSYYNEHLMLIYEWGDKPFAFSPDDKMIVSGGNVYSVKTGKINRKISKGNLKAASVTFSNDSSLLAVGLYNGDVKVWSTETGKLRTGYKGHSSAVTSVDFSADDKFLASGSLDRTAILWSVENP